jgi:hypothetical protein
MWKGIYGHRFLWRYTQYDRFSKGIEEILGLPQEYVAVKFYFRPSFPDTCENRNFISSLIFNIAQKYDVVLLNNGFIVDDHDEFGSTLGVRIHTIEKFVRPDNNLEIQTRVIANAKLFVGTYGGLSYLAPTVGTSSITFYSHREHFLETHLTTAREVFKESENQFLVLDTKDRSMLDILFGSNEDFVVKDPSIVPLNAAASM